MNDKKIPQKYYGFLKDLHVSKTFKNKEICTVHDVNTNTIIVLKKLKFVEMVSYGKSKWIKPEPTEKTVEVFYNALQKYYAGSKNFDVPEQKGQDHHIAEKRLMSLSEAISVCKAAGYKVQKPETQWVEV